MEFIDRVKELELLDEIRRRSEKSARMTVITGRRRIGKTTLANRAYENGPFLYFFVVRKNEVLLCQEFVEEITRALGLNVFGEFTGFARLFEYLLVNSRTNPFTLVIDEFQEFSHVNKAVYGEIQRLWDKYKQTARMNLILCGSVFSMMQKIFEDEKEPLFGRADERINLRPFGVDVIKQLITRLYPDFRKEDLLAFYTITGGAAKYTEIFCDKERFTFPLMLEEIFRDNSLLIDEGRNVLVEEFGKDYGIYFSILSLIASSKTSRPEIESILQKDTGGYLDRLENEYMLIRSIRPVLSRPGGRIQKYAIDDNFLSFWFRFIYKYRSAVEIGNYKYIQHIVERDFNTYSGVFLEKYFREKLALDGIYNIVGSYWEKGNLNELDIVAIDDLHCKALIAEVKMKKERYKPEVLKNKAKNLSYKLEGYNVDYRSFSIEDM
jgi:hypothetical protein